MKYSLRLMTGGVASTLRTHMMKAVAASALSLIAFASVSPAKADIVTGGHVASRGYATGMFCFSCFVNYPGVTSSFQVVQGAYNVSGALSLSDVASYESSVDGKVIAH